VGEIYPLPLLLKMERCEEHGLYLYDNGNYLSCKLGCVHNIKNNNP